MIPETIDIVRRYNTPTLTRHERPRSRIPASTRIIEEIAMIEKCAPEMGRRLTALLFEYKRWVEEQCERRRKENA